MNERRAWLSIVSYREFHDIPRAMVVESPSGWLYLDCPFDEIADDYSQEYFVYQLRVSNAANLPQDWTYLAAECGPPVASIPVRAIEFDETRRTRVRLPNSYPGYDSMPGSNR